MQAIKKREKKLFNNSADRHNSFGIRKLTIGAASVLLGTTLLFGNGNTQKVHADALPSDPGEEDSHAAGAAAAQQDIRQAELQASASQASNTASTNQASQNTAMSLPSDPSSNSNAPVAQTATEAAQSQVAQQAQPQASQTGQSTNNYSAQSQSTYQAPVNNTQTDVQSSYTAPAVNFTANDNTTDYNVAANTKNYAAPTANNAVNDTSVQNNASANYAAANATYNAPATNTQAAANYAAANANSNVVNNATKVANATSNLATANEVHNAQSMSLPTNPDSGKAKALTAAQMSAAKLAAKFNNDDSTNLFKTNDLPKSVVGHTPLQDTVYNLSKNLKNSSIDQDTLNQLEENLMRTNSINPYMTLAAMPSGNMDPFAASLAEDASGNEDGVIHEGGYTDGAGTTPDQNAAISQIMTFDNSQGKVPPMTIGQYHTADDGHVRYNYHLIKVQYKMPDGSTKDVIKDPESGEFIDPNSAEYPSDTSNYFLPNVLGISAYGQAWTSTNGTVTYIPWDQMEPNKHTYYMVGHDASDVLQGHFPTGWKAENDNKTPSHNYTFNDGDTVDVLYLVPDNVTEPINYVVSDPGHDDDNTTIRTDNATGQIGTPINKVYQYQPVLDELSKQGYEVQEGGNPLADTQTPQVFEHNGHVTIRVEPRWTKEDAKPVTIKRTIHYIDSQGNPVKGTDGNVIPDNVQTVTFNGYVEKNAVTGETSKPIYTPGTLDFDSVTSPEVPGKKPNTPAVQKQTVTPDTKDIVVNVIYGAGDIDKQQASTDISRIIEYVDADTGEAIPDPNSTNMPLVYEDHKTVTGTMSHPVGTGDDTKTYAWDGPAVFSDVPSPVIKGYYVDPNYKVVKGISYTPPTSGDLNPSARPSDFPQIGGSFDIVEKVPYHKLGSIVPRLPNGNPVPGLDKTPYQNDPTDPSKVIPNEQVPTDPNGIYTPETPTVTPTDPGKDTPVVYNVKKYTRTINFDGLPDNLKPDPNTSTLPQLDDNGNPNRYPQFEAPTFTTPDGKYTYVPDTITNPDGTTTKDRIIPVSSANADKTYTIHYVRQDNVQTTFVSIKYRYTDKAGSNLQSDNPEDENSYQNDKFKVSGTYIDADGNKQTGFFDQDGQPGDRPKVSVPLQKGQGGQMVPEDISQLIKDNANGAYIPIVPGYSGQYWKMTTSTNGKDDNITYWVIYRPNDQARTAIIHYVDDKGNKLHADTTLQGDVGNVIKNPDKEINEVTGQGYEVVTDPLANNDVKYNDDSSKNEYTIVFKEADSTSNIHFVDKNNKPIHDPLPGSGKVGDPIKNPTDIIKTITDKGYKVVNNPLQDGTVTYQKDPSKNEITITFDNADTNATIHFVNQDDNKVLHDPITPSGKIGDPISNPTEIINDIVNKGYDIVSNPLANGNVTYQQDPAKNDYTIYFKNADTNSKITFIDNENPNDPKPIHDPLTGKGKVGDPINNPTDIIKALIDKGYEVTNNPLQDGKHTYQQDPNKNNYQISFKHGKTDVGPDPDPNKQPGKPINPNDPNGPKWPDENEYRKTYTYTVHFVDKDGNKVAPDATQTAVWGRTLQIDKVTGQILNPNADWTLRDPSKPNYNATKVPVVNGYVASKTSVNGQPVSSTLPGSAKKQQNTEDTVVYNKMGKIVPVDPQGDPIPNVPNPPYKNDPTDPTKVIPNEPVPDIPDKTPAQNTVAPKDPSKDTNVPYTDNATDSNVKVIIHDDITNKDLPQFGWDSGTVKSGTKVNYDWNKTKKDLEDHGYVIENEPVIPGTVPKDPLTVTVNVKHGKGPVNDTTDKHTPGTPINPNDPNGPKWPNSDLYSKDYTYTVNFVNKKTGQPMSDPATQTSHWNRTLIVDKVTGEILNPDEAWKSDKDQYNDVKVTVQEGFVAEKTSKNGAKVSSTLPGVKAEQKNLTDTVYYDTIGRIIPVDENGKPIPGADHPMYKNDPNDPTKVIPTDVPGVNGYTPTQNSVDPADPTKDTDVKYTKNLSQIPDNPHDYGNGVPNKGNNNLGDGDKAKPKKKAKAAKGNGPARKAGPAVRPSKDSAPASSPAQTPTANTVQAAVKQPNAKMANVVQAAPSKGSAPAAKAAPAAKVLPQTGEKNNQLAALGVAALLASSALTTMLYEAKRKRKA